MDGMKQINSQMLKIENTLHVFIYSEYLSKALDVPGGIGVLGLQMSHMQALPLGALSGACSYPAQHWPVGTHVGNDNGLQHIS